MTQAVRRLLKFNLLICVSIVFMTSSIADVPRKGKKKLIEWGLDQPTTSFIRENVAKMERLPFDGLAFPLSGKFGTNLTYRMWGKERIKYEYVKHMVSDLAQTPFVNLTENFIVVGVTPGGVDWFDDAAWDIVLSNFAVAARIAKETKCKGFMFDVEQYMKLPFSFADSQARNAATREEYKNKLNQRGSQLIRTISTIFPDIIIIFPYTYHILEIVKPGYELLPDFLDGVFEAAPKSTRIIDGWEGAYLYKSLGEFQTAYRTVKEHIPQLSRVPEVVKARLEVGFGIRIDGDAERMGWHPQDHSKNYFTPEEFEMAVSYATQTSDEYVWIWSQKLNWWTGERLPTEYLNALKNAGK